MGSSQSRQHGSKEERRGRVDTATFALRLFLDKESEMESGSIFRSSYTSLQQCEEAKWVFFDPSSSLCGKAVTTKGRGGGGNAL